MNKIQVRYYYFFVVALCLGFLSGMSSCASSGYSEVDTTRKAILVATAEVREANSVLQDLITRHAITPEAAQNALNKLREAQSLLQLSLNLIATNGDPVAIESNLARANVIISIALSVIAQFT